MLHCCVDLLRNDPCIYAETVNWYFDVQFMIFFYFSTFTVIVNNTVSIFEVGL